MSNMDPHQKSESALRCSRRVSSSCLLKGNRRKCGKGLFSIRGKKKNLRKMSKDPLSFEIYIFRKGQLDHEHDRIIVLVMTSTWVQRSLV
jgi:hypothetical protein